ncbi:flavin reductase family protein [Falsigemmobacter intermedius]|uniref:Flavin reductase n=1 Tax=Falsigemmobacter intermedius TaxID=1553448 RepID=A0A3S3YHR7_9RHOB|nr:flavin reductase family protein [Falsigemmobacter intermedius]RWY43625.1 flavin reductase [Falsigemmobacter intermedius]
MRIHITDAGAITLIEPANFRGLDVLIDPISPEKLARLVAKIGRFEGEDHIRLAPAVLKFLSPLAGDPEWDKGFEGMIAYAAKAGWVDEAGLVRAHITREEVAPARITLDDFRGSMRRLAAGVSAVTTGTMEEPVGMVASSVVSISAEPPLVGVFVNETSSSLPLFQQNGRMAINILGHDHGAIVGQFVKAAQGRDRFAGADWVAGRSGLPLLTQALVSMECRIITEVSLGTHKLLVGRIETTTLRDDRPMVQFDGTTLRLSEE